MSFILLLLFFIFNFFTYALELTYEEKLWLLLNSHKTFTIHIPDTMNSIFLYKDNTEDSGIYPDMFKDFEKIIGSMYDINFKLAVEPRNVIIDKIKTNELEIGLNLVQNEEREKIYNFTHLPLYYSISFVSKGDTAIKNLYGIKKRKIAIIKNTAEDLLFDKLYPNWKEYKVSVETLDEALEKLEKDEVEGIVIKSEHIRNPVYNVNELIEFPNIHYKIAVSKEYPELFSIINKFFSSYDKKKINFLAEKHKINYYKNLLNHDKDYIHVKNNYSTIKIYLPKTDLKPFYIRNKNKFAGPLIDNINIIEKILDIPIKIITDKNLEHEMTGILDTFDQDNLEVYNFINSYYSVQLAAAGRKDSKFISSLEDINFYKSGRILREGTLKNNTYSSYTEGFKALEKGEIDYLIGDYRMLSIAIQGEYLFNSIMISGLFPQTAKIGYGVKKEHVELSNILKKITLGHLHENNSISRLINQNDLKYSYHSMILIVGSSLAFTTFLLYIITLILRENKKSERIINNLVESFEVANKLNDEDTGMHIIRVNLYSKFLAEKMKCSKSFISEIAKYASLHDVGKIGIKHSILKKEGKLTDEEFEEIKKHVSMGWELVKKMKIGKIAENIALYHHEKWNGKGYLAGLKGVEIPLEARIVAIADVYDALRQKRVYKKSFTHEEALEIILKESDISFDPQIVEVFYENHQKFNEIFIQNREI